MDMGFQSDGLLNHWFNVAGGGRATLSQGQNHRLYFNKALLVVIEKAPTPTWVDQSHLRSQPAPTRVVGC